MMLQQLYQIQKLDTVIGKYRSEIGLLTKQIGDQTDLNTIGKSLEEAREHLVKIRLTHSTLEIKATEIRDKLKRVEDKLYGGFITNLREMESNQRESEILSRKIEELDDLILESMVALEDIISTARNLEAKDQHAKSKWKLKQSELSATKDKLNIELDNLESQRNQLSSKITDAGIVLYERIRASKGGIAVAEIERGLCRVCRVELPTNHVQLARIGREPVLCNSCGRILYAN